MFPKQVGTADFIHDAAGSDLAAAAAARELRTRRMTSGAGQDAQIHVLSALWAHV